MGKKSPRRGSIAFWHRKRAASQTPRVRCWPALDKGLAGFVGYKAGMAQALLVDDSESPLKGQEVTRAITVVAVPPVFAYGVVLYGKTAEGLKVLGQAVASNAPKEARRALTPAKKQSSLEKIEQLLPKAVEARLLMVTQPWKAGIKKTPEVVEVAVGGKNAAEQFANAKALLGREVRAAEVLKEGDYFDAVAVTKGKGWQGVVKRFGVALNPHKATGAYRHGGALGGETQAKIFYTIPRPGQMGYHRRTDWNKRVLKVGSDGSEVTPKAGFKGFGVVKGDYLVVEGSVPGPAKRMIKLRKALRGTASKKPEVRALLI
ncbi:MAG: 50S ribosomal protein L3 [Candidatus Norongarragalinales archaeon]